MWLVVLLTFIQFCHCLDDKSLQQNWLSETDVNNKLIEAADQWKSAEDALSQFALQTDIKYVSSHVLAFEGSSYNEIEELAQFESFLAQRNITAVLFANHERLNVPGFDGVFLDESGKILSNFSLKGRHSENSHTFFNLLKNAIAKLKEFSKWSGWTKIIINQSGKMVEDSRSVRENIKKIGQLGKVFGVGTNRPNWLMVFVHSETNLQPAVAYRAAGLIETEKVIVQFAQKQKMIIVSKTEKPVTLPAAFCMNQFL